MQSPPTTLSHTLPITLPDWIYANWTKIKSHLRGDPSWDSFVHTPTLARKSHSMISSGFNLQPSRWLGKACLLPFPLSKGLLQLTGCRRNIYKATPSGRETKGETFLFRFSTVLFAQKDILFSPHPFMICSLSPCTPLILYCIYASVLSSQWSEPPVVQQMTTAPL